MCLKSNETGATNILLTTQLQINTIPFEVVLLGSHTLLETLLPLPVPVLLEVFMWKCPQLVCNDLLDVVHTSKMTTFEAEFEFREKEENTQTQIRRVWGLQNHWNILFGQKFVKGDSNVTECPGSIVMQHPRVRNLWPDTMNPLSELFKDFTIVPIILTVKRWSDLTRAHTSVTFSSVFDVQGLPEWSLSSTLSYGHPKMLCAT